MQDAATTIHRTFERTVDRCPDRCAVRERDRAWTYREVEALANGVAHRLLESNGLGGEPVATLLANGGQGLATAYGILKSGNYFVGLSVWDPPARLRIQLEHARTRHLMTHRKHEELAKEIAAPGVQVLVVDDLQSTSRPVVEVTPDALCMVVFTSGSTGLPKAIAHSHRNQCFNSGCLVESLRLGETDRMTLFGSLAGGASTTMVTASFCTGAMVCPYDLKSAGATDLADWLETEGITILNTGPTMFRHFTRRMDRPREFKRLRLVRLGGEPMLAVDVDLFRQHFGPHTALINTLGITEIGQISSYTVDLTRELPEPIPVGPAFPGRRLLVLDDAGRELPPGEPGELYVESSLLSSGYLHNDVLTRERFTRAPHDPERTRYRTGDRAFLAPDGTCTLLGREDQQAKIGGLTVRVGEMEGALLSHPDVMEAVLRFHADGKEGQRLVAYVVPRDGAPLTGLQEFLASRFPPNMVPSTFIRLTALPRTISGKVDLAALSAGQPETTQPGAAPMPLEDALRKVWHELLGPKSISLEDNFFALGGESLMAVDLLTAISRDLGEHVHLSMLHDAPTIATQARYLEAHHPAGVARWLGRTVVRTEIRAHPVLASLKPTGAYPPFFCIPGAGTDAFGLSDIAKSVSAAQPFYSFNAPGLDGQSLPLRSVGELARCYLDAIKTCQPQGPYFLGGSSFGGKVAFELTRQLLDRGEKVALLALLDTWGPGYPARRPMRGVRRRLLFLVRWFLPIGLREELTWKNFRLGLYQRRQRLIANLALRLRIPMKPLSPMLRFACLIESSFMAQRGYRLQPLASAAVLFRAEQQPPRALYEEDPQLGWVGLLQHGLRIVDIPGRHGEHERFPHAAELGRKLQQALDEARAG